MIKEEYAILVFIGVILMFLSFFISPLLGLLIFSLSLLFVSIFNILSSDNIIKFVSNLFILAGTLSLIPFFSSIVNIGINLSIINNISVYIIIFAIILLVIYYLYITIRDALSFIEVRIKK